MERESPVGFSAAILAEYKSRKAIRAPPFKWSRQAELASCCSWHTLSTEKAMQVRTNPGDKVFHVGLLKLPDMSNTTEGHTVLVYSPSFLPLSLALLSRMFHLYPLMGGGLHGMLSSSCYCPLHHCCISVPSFCWGAYFHFNISRASRVLFSDPVNKFGLGTPSLYEFCSLDASRCHT